MAEHIALAYRLFTMRRWATAAAWACGLVWRNASNDRRAEVERAVRQRM